jgi:hypothetical protein
MVKDNLPEITEEQFEAMDANSNGEITKKELKIKGKGRGRKAKQPEVSLEDESNFDQPEAIDETVVPQAEALVDEDFAPVIDEAPAQGEETLTETIETASAQLKAAHEARKSGKMSMSSIIRWRRLGRR